MHHPMSFIELIEDVLTAIADLLDPDDLQSLSLVSLPEFPRERIEINRVLGSALGLADLSVTARDVHA